MSKRNFLPKHLEKELYEEDRSWLKNTSIILGIIGIVVIYDVVWGNLMLFNRTLDLLIWILPSVK